VGWWGDDPGQWSLTAAPIEQLPALLNALEQRGREPRFVVPLSASVRDITPAELGCRVIPPLPGLPGGQEQCCWFDGPGGAPRCIIGPLGTNTETTFVYVASRAAD
jgi:hypothetical protein